MTNFGLSRFFEAPNFGNILCENNYFNPQSSVAVLRMSITIGFLSGTLFREEFAKFYEESVNKGEEGVVAKKIDSLYKTGARQMINGWFKVSVIL